MKLTPNFGFEKPETNDKFSLARINKNADLLDNTLLSLKAQSDNANATYISKTDFEAKMDVVLENLDTINDQGYLTLKNIQDNLVSNIQTDVLSANAAARMRALINSLPEVNDFVTEVNKSDASIVFSAETVGTANINVYGLTDFYYDKFTSVLYGWNSTVPATVYKTADGITWEQVSITVTEGAPINKTMIYRSLAKNNELITGLSTNAYYKDFAVSTWPSNYVFDILCAVDFKNSLYAYGRGYLVVEGTTQTKERMCLITSGATTSNQATTLTNDACPKVVKYSPQYHKLFCITDKADGDDHKIFYSTDGVVWNYLFYELDYVVDFKDIYCIDNKIIFSYTRTVASTGHLVLGFLIYENNTIKSYKEIDCSDKGVIAGILNKSLVALYNNGTTLIATDILKDGYQVSIGNYYGTSSAFQAAVMGNRLYVYSDTSCFRIKAIYSSINGALASLGYDLIFPVDRFAAENPFPDGIIPVSAGIYKIGYYVSSNDVTYTAAQLTSALAPLITGITITGTTAEPTSLTQVIIPQRILVPTELVTQYGLKYYYEVQKIGDEAFNYSFYNLTKVVLPNSLLLFGHATFYNAPVTDITVPISAKWTYNTKYPTFSGAPAIVRITKGIDGKSPYTDDTGYWQRATLPWSIYSSSRISTSLIIEKGVKMIGAQMFSYGGSGVDKVILPEGLTDIKLRGLNMTGLKTVVLPSTLTHLGIYSVGGGALGVVYFRGTQAQWDAVVKDTDGYGGKWYGNDYSTVPTIICNYTAE